MCIPGLFGSTPKDNSADIARQEEMARQGRITEGRAAIDQQFGQFDDPYYAKLQSGYSDAYLPDLQSQYDEARRKLVLQLAQSGNLNASTGAKQIGDLATAYQKNRTLIGDRAVSAAQTARGSVESAKNELYGQLSASADPGGASQAAIARAAALSAPPSYSPLGDLFASFAAQGANAAAAERTGYPGWQTGLFTVPKGGSSVVVR